MTSKAEYPASRVKNVNIIKQQTAVRRNRCHLDTVAQTRGLDIDKATIFGPDLAKEIVKDHWATPSFFPGAFPINYPPEAPLLDTPLPESVAHDLQRAFTQNNVTYAAKDVEGNLVLELLGDKYMSFLLAQNVQEDLRRNEQNSIYHDLDLGGLDVSCGSQQMYG